MAEYGSGIFYGRSKSIQNLTNISQLGLLSLPPELDIGPPLTPQTFKIEDDVPKDIILLAEFSEIEGPIPLLSIPLNCTHDLNLYDFVLQLMSTDYHSFNKSDFQIHEDTCLLQEDPETGHNTYVHYFTLYDVRARGFVRPMCLAYISRELQKLKKYFKIIQSEFYKATDYLRVCNLKIFSEELKTRIQDLHFTKERYIQSHHQFEKEESKVNATHYKAHKSQEILHTLNHSSEMASISQNYIRPSRPQSLNKRYNLKEDVGIDESLVGSFQEKLNISSSENSIRYKNIFDFSVPRRIRTTSESSDSQKKSISLSSSLPVIPVLNESPQTNNLKFNSCINSPYNHYITRSSPSQSELTPSKESLKEAIIENLSYSSDSSTSTLKSARPFKSPRSFVQASSLMHDHSLNEVLNNKEEISVLQHTSLEALAVQLLDCQYILEVIKKFLENCKVCEEITDFLDEVKSKPQSPLNSAMEELGLLNSISESKKNPAIFVISLMRRNFKNIRSIRLLCGVGYIACIAHLLVVYKRFSKSTLTLIFEELDRKLYENPFSSLFIGNIPAVFLGRDHYSKHTVPRTERFSLIDACWNEDLVNLLRTDLSKATTPDSEYSDAKEVLDKTDVAVADDCLEVFSQGLTSAVEREKRPVPFTSQISEELSESEIDRLKINKSNNVCIKDSSHHSTPIRSTSSDSSWASSTPRDLNFIEGIDNETEEEGEEEEAIDNGTERNVIRLTQQDIEKRLTTAKVYRTSALIQQFSGVSQCIVHTILSGKPMILAGPEYLRSVVILYAKSLASILPVKPNAFLPVLKWHTGTITPYHLEMYKIIGTCIPERLHVQDLMSNATLNQVTVLNIETGHISGVAYSGNLLHKADQLSRRHFRSDQSLQSALQSILISLGMKVFLHFHLKRTTTRTSNEILKAIGVPRGDWVMIQYLSTLVEEQERESLSLS